MSTEVTSNNNQWSSRWLFILAATGSAVGLGNIWKFPYITGENGGGAFVLVYLLCIILIGIPVMMAEIMLGRRGGNSPINAMRAMAKEAKKSRLWSFVGWMGVLAGFLILSYYSVIAGWTFAYIPKMATGEFTGMDATAVGAVFDQLMANPWQLLFWHTVVIVITLTVVGRGLHNGLEKLIQFLMPMLFLILLILVGYAMNTGHFGEGLTFLFSPDFSKLTAESILVAMGHAFFTLSLGMGAIMVYGAYLPKDISIVHVSVSIAIADTAVALLAGMAIFPIIFANGLDTGSGVGLVFTTLPLAFSQMTGGYFFGSLFFLLLLFAALTSTISLIEPAVAWLSEKKQMTRKAAAVWCGILTWTFGLLTVFSFNILQETRPLGMLVNTTFEDKTFFDLLDYLTSNIMLPLGGLLIALFVGWKMQKAMSAQEINTGKGIYTVWLFLLRYVTPIAVFVVFLKSLGLF